MNGWVDSLGLRFVGVVVSALIVVVAGCAVDPPQPPVDCSAPPAPGVNWSGCDKSGIDLTGAVLDRALLVGTDLSDSILDRVSLVGADLRRSDLTEATLVCVDLDNANLSESTLVRTRIDGDLWDVTPFSSETCIPSATSAVFNRANLSGAVIRGAYDVTLGMLGWKAAQFEDARFVGADLTGATIHSVDLRRADFRDATMDAATVKKVDLDHGRMDRSNLINAMIDESSFRNVAANGINLSLASMGWDTTWEGTNLSSADISGVDWQGVTCPDGVFSVDVGDSCVGHLTP